MLRAKLTALTVYLTILVALPSRVNIAEAQVSRGWLVRILPDGSISPPHAPITRVGRVYYMTEDLEVWGSDGIIVEASGIILDGGGRAARGDGSWRTRGVLVKGSNVVVANLVVEAFHYGVMVAGASGVVLQNVTVSRCSEGVAVVNSSKISVENSVLIGNVVGVNVLFSNSVEVVGNRVEGGTWGLYVMNSTDAFLTRNVVVNSSWGLTLLYSSSARVVGNEFWGCGTYVRGSYKNLFTGNWVNGKPLVYLEGATGVEVREAGQVVLVRSRGIRISNVSITRASVGALLIETSDSVVELSYLARNSWGVMLHSSSNNTIRGNWVELNDVGIYLYDSRGNAVVDNALLRNGLGLWLACSELNSIYGNCFIVNRIQAVAGCGENHWTGPAGGNFWSDGDDEDQDRDGFADKPYRVGYGNVDGRPLSSCRLESIARLAPPRCSLSPYGEAQAVAGQSFLVAIRAESPLPLTAVRFELRVAERVDRTEWFAWDVSRGRWDAARKTIWLTVPSPGPTTIDAVVRDAAGRLASCSLQLNVAEQEQRPSVEEPETAPQPIDLTRLAAAIAVLALAVLIVLRRRQSRPRSRVQPAGGGAAALILAAVPG